MAYKYVETKMTDTAFFATNLKLIMTVVNFLFHFFKQKGNAQAISLVYKLSVYCHIKSLLKLPFIKVRK